MSENSDDRNGQTLLIKNRFETRERTVFAAKWTYCVGSMNVPKLINRSRQVQTYQLLVSSFARAYMVLSGTESDSRVGEHLIDLKSGNPSDPGKSVRVPWRRGPTAKAVRDAGSDGNDARQEHVPSMLLESRKNRFPCNLRIIFASHSSGLY